MMLFATSMAVYILLLLIAVKFCEEFRFGRSTPAVLRGQMEMKKMEMEMENELGNGNGNVEIVVKVGVL